MGNQYSFSKELAKSHEITASTVKEILDCVFGDVAEIRAATAQEQSDKIDFVFRFISGRVQSCDIKVRHSDFLANDGRDDLVAETVSHVKNGTPGWAVDTASRCDWTVWYWPSTGRYRVVSTHLLRAAIKTNLDIWSQSYSMPDQRTAGLHESYASRAICVPTKELARALWGQAGGHL